MLLRFTFLAAALSCFAVAQPPSAHWSSAIQAGVKAYRNEEPDAAMKHFRDALEIAENFAEADPRLFETLGWLLLTHEEFQEANEPEAKSYLDRALRIRPKVKGSDL